MAAAATVDPVYPGFNCCARRSSLSHESRNGAPVVGSVVVEAIGGEVVGCSCRVVMGAVRKSFYHQKRFHESFLLEPLPPQHLLSWEALFTHRNELLHGPWKPSRLQKASWELFFTVRNKRSPQLELLSALPHGIVHPNGKEGIFLKKTFMADLI